MDEGELLRGLMRREGQAFECLVEAYQHRLFSFVLRYGGSRQDAEEIVQDTLLKAYRALYFRLTPERVLSLALTPWLFRIALNTARNHTRRRRPETTGLPEEQGGVLETQTVLAADGGPEVEAERSGARAAIVAELRRLPERYRACVILRLVEGLRYEEVATATGLPLGTVKSHVHRGLLLMRPGLEPWWRAAGEEEKKT